MKKIILTFSLVIGLLALFSFTNNSEKVEACWTQCTTTTCGTGNCNWACSAASHYGLAMLDDEWDCE